MTFHAFAASIALSLLYAASSLADGMIIIDRPPVSNPEWRGIPLAVNYHHVDVAIDNQTALTTVDQEFRNPNNMQIEGLYIFPLPAGAAVSNFSMWIDGKEQEAELLDREKASQIYEDIVRRMRDPALLEYMGTKAFKLRIFPIPALGTKRVKLSYSEVVTNDGGFCTYRYPLNTEKFSSSPLQNVTVKIDLKSRVAMKNIFSPSHDIDVAKRGDHIAVASYEKNNIKPDKDFLLYYTVSTEEVGINVVTYKPAGEDGYFMILASPQQEGSDSAVIQKDVNFVVDTSGSMAEQDKMEQAKKALQFCISALQPSDRFNIIAFSTEPRPFKPELIDASKDNIAAALEFVSKLRPRGGTNISDSLKMALDMTPKASGRPYMVVFMTDGQPTIGATTVPAEILAGVKGANTAQTRIFSLGVGYDVNTHLLDKLAEENRGTRDYVTPDENLEIKVSNFYEKLAHPVLADAKLAIDGLETYDVYPKALGDMFKGSQVVVYGRYKGEGHKAVRLTGSVNGSAREFVYEGAFAAAGAETHELLPRLWATSKIGYLLDAIRLHGEKAELKQEVVALAKEFGILTPYTSFLVLEDQMRPQPGGGGGASEPAGLRRAMDDRKADAEEGGRSFGQTAGAPAVEASKAANEMKKGKSEAGEKDQATMRETVRQVGNKTFYNNDGVWTDSKFRPGMTTVKVKSLGDEYFKLVLEKGELKKFFALGRVIVVLGDTAYEVTE